MMIKKVLNLRIWALTVSMILIYSACKKEEPVIEPPSNPLCTVVESISEAKEYLLSKHVNILLTQIEETATQYEITFEDSSILKFDLDLLNSFDIQEEQWSIHFIFNDGTNLDINYLGNTFSILPENIIWNSSGISPLSARVTFETLVLGSIRVKVLGKGTEGIAIEKQFSRFRSYHEFPVLGLSLIHI